MKRKYGEISINSHIYKVYLVKNLSQNTDYAGLCDPVKKEIFVCSDLKKDAFIRVLLHELAHGLIFETGMMEFMNEQSQEMVCETFAGFLTGTFDIRLKRKK